MSRMRSVDLGTGFADALRWIAPPSLPVCESAQVLYTGSNSRDANRKTEGGPWPFLLSYGNDGRVTVNRANRTTPYEDALTAGVALL